MQIQEKTDDRLVLTDTQSDKVIGAVFGCVALVAGASLFAWEGLWIPALIMVALVPLALVYVKLTSMASSVVLDRSQDAIHLSVKSRKGSETWDWKLSALETAEVSQTRRQGITGGVFRPDLVMKDGTRVPMRPYHSAGSQSWHAVAGVKLFLGQRLDDAPVGWIPPEEFDRHFKEEMSRLYK
ncbi:MAG: hypothetical protein AAGL24_11485 [Pseudomonadota bacterium]